MDDVPAPFNDLATSLAAECEGHAIIHVHALLRAGLDTDVQEPPAEITEREHPF